MNFIIFISALSLGVFILILLIIYLTIRGKIRKKIDKQDYVLNYPDWLILFFSSYIEKISISYGRNLPVLMGIDNIWVKQIKNHPGKNKIKKLLKYSPDKNLFTVLKAALGKNNLQPILTEWMDKSGEFMVLRKIAVSGKGESFDGEKALLFFHDNMGEITEMMGDYDWRSRYFAINILVHSSERSAEEAVWESFKDPSILVRTTAVKLFITEKREKLYSILLSLVLNDPSFEVRNAARIRINRDLEDLYNVKPMELEITQQLHLIELLNPESKQDENIAIEFMKSGNKELELYASRFLTNNGTLKRLFQTADPGYAKGFEDTFGLLMVAVEVSCTTFIDLNSNISTGSILLASRILSKNGNRNIITDLVQKVFSITRGKEAINPYREIYVNSIECVCKRGNDEALKLLNAEIFRRRYDEQFQEWILKKIPYNHENIFASTLMGFLKDENYPAKGPLRGALSKFPPSSTLPEIISILRSDQKQRTREIRIEGLKLLGSLKLPHCTQYILENLSILPLNEAKEFSSLLNSNSIDTFRDKVRNIISFGDSTSMAHLIAALPESECRFFLPDIKNALKNNNPEVRIAAVWALRDYNKGEFLSSCFKLLLDPVEKVREEVGKTLGEMASKETITVLKEALFDANESLPVKSAVLNGLAVSGSREAAEIILLKMEENIELSEECTRALSCKNKKSEIKMILKFMDGTTPVIRNKIIKAFRGMGPDAELFLEELLSTGDQILHKHITAILEDSGLVDLRIRQLSHRNPETRKTAAAFLLKTGTKAAYRGIIMAAKDPDEEIRIMVVKALDVLNSPRGLPILEELKNDPAKRVKRYTLWALERYEAKKLI